MAQTISHVRAADWNNRVTAHKIYFKVMALLLKKPAFILILVLTLPGISIAFHGGKSHCHPSGFMTNPMWVAVPDLLERCTTTYSPGAYCWAQQEPNWPEHADICYEPAKYVAVASAGEATCNRQGNPCDVVTGRKVQVEEDILLSNFALKRYYDSDANRALVYRQ